MPSDKNSSSSPPQGLSYSKTLLLSSEDRARGCGYCEALSKSQFGVVFVLGHLLDTRIFEASKSEEVWNVQAWRAFQTQVRFKAEVQFNPQAAGRVAAVSTSIHVRHRADDIIHIFVYPHNPTHTYNRV